MPAASSRSLAAVYSPTSSNPTCILSFWSWIDGNLPNCFVGLLPYNKVDRDEFFDAISGSVELKVISDTTPTITITDDSGNVIPSALRLRQETYEIIGGWPAKRLRLLLSSTNDGTVSGASIYMDPAGDAPHDR